MNKLWSGLGMLAWIGGILFGTIGYVLNIVHLIASIGDPLSTKLVLRIVGIFAAPVGAIMGYVS